MPNSHRVELCTDNNIVPDCSILRDNYLADQGCIRGDPGIINICDNIIEGHHLTVAREILHVADIIIETRSESVHGQAGLLEDLPDVVVHTLGDLAHEIRW
jgi:hypothetical protein